MKNYRRFIFILVILLISSLVACTRSASQPSTKPAEDTGTSEEVSGTEEPLGVLEQMATRHFKHCLQLCILGATQTRVDTELGFARVQ